MPSLVGIINKESRELNKEHLSHMHTSVMDDPDYSIGTYCNDELGIYLAWTAHKQSFADCMPICNTSKDNFLFFIGEDFSDDRNNSELNKDHTAGGNINASYILNLYEKYGETFVRRLNGIFSGVIVDLRKNKILLFIDRYGLQRVYFRETNNGIYFSSKAGAIAKILPECRQIDYKSLGEFLSCRCVLENRSLFLNINQLPAASIWTILPGDQPKKKKSLYFDPKEWENQEPLNQEQFYTDFREQFPKIVSSYVTKQDKMFLSLTGGLDTRLILAASDFLPDQLPCYTHSGMFNESYDVKIARKVAKICRQPHRVIEVGTNFLEEFNKLAEKTVQITDGHLDVTESVGLYTCQIIKKEANCRLTGNYGSEILRYYVMFKHSMPDASLFDPDFIKNIKLAKQTYDFHRQLHPLTFIAFRQVPWYHYNRFSLEQSQIVQRSPYLDNKLVKLAYRVPQDRVHTTDIPIKFVHEMNPALASIRTDRGVGKDDAAITSILVRGYSEFLFKMDYYFNHGMPSWFAKSYKFWAPFGLERKFLGRHKYNHFRVWFRDQLASYISEILLDRRTITRPYLNGNLLEKIVKGHLSGRYNYTQEISLLLTVELMHRCFIDN